MFHLAGIPSYLVVAELAVNQVLRGDLPRPEYRRRCVRRPRRCGAGRAAATLHYAKGAYVRRGQAAEVAGALATAAMNMAHAVPAARGGWVTNEKRLLQRAGLRGIDEILTGLRPEPAKAAASAATAHRPPFSSWQSWRACPTRGRAGSG
ncbi:hypothetical protein GCM10020219_039080 [Nonomuraea dietziae]